MVRIRFTEGTGIKMRPAVVLTGGSYHGSRADAIVVALSTQRAVEYYGDCDLLDWSTAGLPQPTKAKGVIQTIERTTVDRRLGTLSQTDFERVKESVRLTLGLWIKKRHEDTAITLHPLTFERALPMLAQAPKQKGSQAEGSDSTKEHAPESAPSKKRTSPHGQSSGD